MRNKGLPTGKIPEKVLEWKGKQKRGAIMKPSTFAKIKRAGNKKYGKGHGENVAGTAYQTTLKKKYKESHGEA
ncbi:hypothetical protein KKE60_05970 [Patescibacteria group bacterium]|nr:hypothetical protein [Patescibacteria group bacterium]